MSRSRSREEGQTKLDWAIEGFVAAMLLFLPLAYGTTQPWSQEIFFLFVAAIGVCTLARFLINGEPIAWTWTYVPIILFLGLLCVQRLPMPRGLLGVLSPHTLTLKDDLLGGAAAPGNATLTFYALATERQLRLVLCVVTIFAVVVQFYRTPQRRRRLLMSVAAAGMAVALLAAYQDLTKAETIYGVVPVGHKNAGPFQNYSHFSQFMNLSIGAALAWLLMSLAGWSNGWRDGAAAREQSQLVENAFVWPAAALVLGGPLLVFASMSRMGMISMLAAGALTAGLLGWRGRPSSGRRRRSGTTGRQRGRSLFYVVSFAVAVVAVLSVFGFDWVFDRLRTVQTQQETTLGTRQNVLRDLVPLWKQFPLFGTGLGTHEFIFPLFNRQSLIIIFTHAENEYAQLMEETGLAGVLLAATFLAIVAIAFVRVIRTPKRPEQYAAFGLGFGLIAVLIHSSSDFGQHVPADATLTAICCGLLICLARSEVSRPAPAGRPKLGLRGGRVLAGVATLAFCGTGAWVILAGDAERRAAEQFDVAQDAGADIVAGHYADDDFTRMADASAAAYAALPSDVVYAHWAAVARWQKLSHETLDATTGQLRLPPERVAEVRSLINDLTAARQLCPTYGPPLGLAGQLRVAVLGDPRGKSDIRTAYRLTPHDRDLCRMAGMQAVEEKRWDEAMEILGRYIRLGGPTWRVVDALMAADRPDLAQTAAAGDWRNLKRLGIGLAVGWPKEQARAVECRRQSDRLLVQESESPDASADLCYERGQLEEQNGRAGDAILWYQKAVDADYDRPDWHLALAKALLSVDRGEDADRELRVCLRQRPNWDEVQKLLELNRRRRSDKQTGH